jgi:hypothetical protein
MSTRTVSDPSVDFDHRKQTLALFKQQSFRWIGTVVFSIFVITTLKIYEDKGNISPGQKATFNVIITALSLGLGLNFFVSQATLKA